MGGSAVCKTNKSGINLHHECPFTESACPELVHLIIYNIFPPSRLKEQTRDFAARGQYTKHCATAFKSPRTRSRWTSQQPSRSRAPRVTVDFTGTPGQRTEVLIRRRALKLIRNVLSAPEHYVSASDAGGWP